MKKLIKRILKETPSTWFYPPINIGDWSRQCLLCITGKQLYSQMANVSCSKPCSENLWNPAVECIMCVTWKAMHPQAQDCGNICSMGLTGEWGPFNIPCYKCDKFGKMQTVWNYSQWGASQGPCPSGYAKDPDPFGMPIEQRNPCDSFIDDNLVRAHDDIAHADSPTSFRPSNDENIDIDLEEINESHSSIYNITKNNNIMKNNNIIQEEINRATQLWGYDTSKPLFEQTTGTTGGGIPICMGITAQGCPGTPEANTTMTTPTTKCATIDNIQVTTNDVGRDIIAPMGGVHMTVQTVFPNVTGNGSENVSSAPGPCPRPSGPVGPTGCNKSCQQLASNFKKKAQGKPCNWLNNRLNAFLQKLPSTTPGSCNGKRISCKIRVVKALIQQQGC